MKVLFAAVVVAGGWLFLPPVAAACACGGTPDPCVAVNAADVVFVGRVTQVERDASEPPNRGVTKARFDVLEVLSGTVPDVVELRSDSCSWGFQTDRYYVVYARYHEGMLMAGVCSRTGELADRRHDVDILRGRPGRDAPVPRLAGRITETRQLVDGGPGSEARPLAGVTVTARSGTAVYHAITGADGRFVFMNVPAGEYTVTTELSRTYEQVSGEDVTVRLRGCYGEVNIQATRVPLHGTLTRGDGTPESMPVTVRAYAIDGSQRAPSNDRSTFTYVDHVDRGGRWKFTGLPPGEYLIHVGVETGRRWDPLRIPFWYPAAARPEDAAIVRIDASGVVRLALRHPPAPPEVRFSGVMVDRDGRPVHGGAWLFDLDAGHDVANGPADWQGRFEVRGWEGRRYTITAYNCSGREPAMSEPVPLDPAPTEPLRLVLTRPCPASPR